MITINYSINATGKAEIHEFLQQNHKASRSPAHEWTPAMLDAWAADAEFQLDEGNGATIEIPAHNSVTGAAVTYTISKTGIDAVEAEIDE